MNRYHQHRPYVDGTTAYASVSMSGLLLPLRPSHKSGLRRKSHPEQLRMELGREPKLFLWGFVSVRSTDPSLVSDSEI